jgi:hypothetical protein
MMRSTMPLSESVSHPALRYQSSGAPGRAMILIFLF